MDHQIKLLFIPGSFPPRFCGIGDYSFQLSRQLSKNTELFLYIEKDLDSFTENTFYYKHRKSFHLFKLIKIYRKNRFNIIHLQYPTRIFSDPFFILSLIVFKLLFRKIKIVTTIHEIKPYLLKGKKKNIHSHAGYWIKHFIIKQVSSHIITTNREEFKITNHSMQNTSIIPIFPTVDFSDKFSENENTKLFHPLKEKKIILFFGNLHASKSLDKIIKALYFLDKEYVFVVAYGNDHQQREREKHERLAKELKIEKRMVWYHRLSPSNLHYLIKLSHVTILPYKNGISPRSSVFLIFLEQNKKTICQKGSETPLWLTKLVENSYDKTTSPEILAQKIIQTMNSPVKKTQRKDSIKNYFSIQSVEKKHLTLYQKLLSPKILTIRKYKLGDSLLWTPFLRELKNRHPYSTIDLISGYPYMIEFWRHYPFINHVFVEIIPHKNILKKIKHVRTIRKQKYDIVYISSMETGSALKSFLYGIPQRIGFRSSYYYSLSRDPFAFLLTRSIKARKKQRESARNLKLLDEKSTSIDFRPFFPYKKQPVKSIIPYYSNGPIILLNPLGDSPGRSLLPPIWKKLLNHLEFPKNSIILLPGSKDKKSNLHHYLTLIDHSKKYNIAGMTSFNDLAFLISKSALTLTVDCGITHLCSALKAPQIVIWGPGNYEIFNPVYDENDETFVFFGDCQNGPCQELCNSPTCYSNIPFDKISQVFNKLVKSHQN